MTVLAGWLAGGWLEAGWAWEEGLSHPSVCRIFLLQPVCPVCPACLPRYPVCTVAPSRSLSSTCQPSTDRGQTGKSRLGVLSSAHSAGACRINWLWTGLAATRGSRGRIVGDLSHDGLTDLLTD